MLSEGCAIYVSGDTCMSRPVDQHGLARKEALRTAWSAVSVMTGRAVAERLGVSAATFYAWGSASEPNQPSRKALRVVAAMVRNWSNQLAAQADTLDRAADEPERPIGPASGPG